MWGLRPEIATKLQPGIEHLLAPTSPTCGIILQSLLEVITLNDITCKPANTQIGQGDVIIE